MKSGLIKDSLGNLDLLDLKKTAFLCSRHISASAVLKCYDWAIAQREAGICVISGFHSPIEKDVLHYLLKGQQPIIVALARGLKKVMEPELIKGIDSGRILIVTPFDRTVTRVTENTSLLRNQLMVDIADHIVIGYLSEKSRLIDLISSRKQGGVEFL